jgi:hypothetical protein
MAGHDSILDLLIFFDFGFSIVGTSLPSQEIPFAILESKIGNPNLKFYRMSIASP